MRPIRMFGGLWAWRRAIRALETIGEQLTRQNVLMERLANQIAPLAPVTNPAEVAALTGVDHLDALEVRLVDEYVVRTERDTGHTPTEDEVLSYLADERTLDLHTRLVEREREVDRWVAERQERST
jgi:hypothetical protein